MSILVVVHDVLAEVVCGTHTKRLDINAIIDVHAAEVVCGIFQAASADRRTIYIRSVKIGSKIFSELAE